MINDYLKQLESAIIPRKYNSEYFKQTNGNKQEKNEIVLSEMNHKDNTNINFNKADQLILEGDKKVSSENENMKLLNEYLRRSGYKETAETITSNPNKVKLYQKILESDIKKTKNEKVSVSSNEVASNDEKNNTGIENAKLRSSTAKNDHRSSLQEKSLVSNNINISKTNYSKKLSTSVEKNDKFTQLHFQSINYRHEIETLQNTLKSLEKKYLEQQNVIDTLEKQKENDDKYLLKLEDIYKQEQMKNKNNLNISLNVSNTNNNISNAGNEDNILAGVNLKDKNQLNNLITNLINENYKLKHFQAQVLEISKNYDDINENIVNNMKSTQSYFRNNNYPNSSNINEYLENFNKILTSSVDMVQSKQRNYNLTLANKENEIIILSKEIEKIKNTIEMMKNDTIKDNKIIHDFENENIMLSNKVAEFEKLYDNKQKKSPVKERNEEKLNIVKNSVQNMMNNFNQNLDLNDKSNIKFVETLNSKLKY